MMTTLDKINFLLDALEDGETNFRFDENRFGSKKMNRTLNRIKDLFAKKADTVRREMEESESVAWQRMIRVLTHEIMNTVAPIASLSQTLKQVEGPELQAGLDTIATASQGLIRFVNSYYDLTHLSDPMKKAFFVRDLVAHVVELTSAYDLKISFTERTPDVLLYADHGQLSQVLVNLVKNAAEAGAKRVDISAEISEDDCTIINVSNDGQPIPPDAQHQLFTPFFTTKSQGSGIGLNLSRQIMRRHGGTLSLTTSDNHLTIFTLRLG